MKARLQRLIADSGLCSRRKAEGLLEEGRVTVNGKRVGLGDSADPEKDVIAIDGKPISAERKVYYLLNKPAGYECTLESTTGKPLATDMVPTDFRIFPVGRLDADSRGLLILTNDGDFANRIIHPSSSLDKEYIVTVDGVISDGLVDTLRRGVLFDGKMTRPCEVEVKERNPKTTVLRFVLHEGRKRQIRRMLAAIGFSVVDLQRERIGPITLSGLKEGKFRPLTEAEVQSLKDASLHKPTK